MATVLWGEKMENLVVPKSLTRKNHGDAINYLNFSHLGERDFRSEDGEQLFRLRLLSADLVEKDGVD